MVLVVQIYCVPIEAFGQWLIVKLQIMTGKRWIYPGYFLPASKIASRLVSEGNIGGLMLFHSALKWQIMIEKEEKQEHQKAIIF